MIAPTASFAAREEFVAAFEAARSAGAVFLADYLPPPEHPQHRAILSEMVRVDLEFGWTEGAPTALEQYLEQFPELRADPASLAAIAYEEFRLRRQAGQTPNPDEYVARYNVEIALWPKLAPATNGDLFFPPTHCLEQAARAYQSQVRRPHGTPLPGTFGRKFFDDLHAYDAAAAQRVAQSLTDLPAAGEKFLEFRLTRELGRGAFGRVFLAEQDGLAGRRVALKIAADLVGESQTLAQLQHTHIVPIYSVHQSGALQAVCMPYLGGSTVADLLAELARRPTQPRRGLELLSASRIPERTESPPPTVVVSAPPTDVVAGPAPKPAEPELEVDGKVGRAAQLPLSPAIRKRLEGCSYVEAVLWLGECLADGLAHAHERGILHRDLKPANVLLTDDGQPMLLDFNLAEDTKLRGSASGALVGGTLLYMSPEHLESFQGQPYLVDERCDLYALGVILYQLLTRQYPFASGSNSGRPRLGGKRSGSSLPELIEEMKVERRQPAPWLRGANPDISPAAEAIIRKCLDPEPERRYQSARDLQEDLRRQLDGMPLKHAAEPSWRERAGKWRRRNARLVGKAAIVGVIVLTVVAAWLSLAAYRSARGEQAWSALDGFRQDRQAAQGLLTAQGDDPADRAQGIAVARQALERYPVLRDVNWQAHTTIVALPEVEQDRLRREVGELLLLLAREKSDASRDRQEELRDARQRLELNERAEACFTGDVPAALWWQRAELLRELDQRDASERLRERAEQTPPRTAADYFLSAREFAGQGKPQQALPLLRQATRLDPRHYWAWFLLGKCLGDAGEDVKAATCYSVRIALQPQSIAGYFNRGLAHAQLKDFPQARADFDQALGLDAKHLEARLNRALVRLNQQDLAGAEEDLTEALRQGAGATRIYFLRARIRDQKGDRAGAEEDRAEGMRREPTDEKSWLARGWARIHNEPEQALADFDRALALDPRSRAALRNKAHVLAEKLNRPQEAVAALDEVVRYYPDFATARAERGVMHARLGNRALALADAKEALQRDARPPLRYQVGCIYALTSRTAPEDRPEALRLLREAVRFGYGSTLIAADGDLDPLRALPEFQRLVAATAALNAPLK